MLNVFCNFRRSFLKSASFSAEQNKHKEVCMVRPTGPDAVRHAQLMATTEWSTWNFVEGSVSLDKTSQNIPSTGQTVCHSTHHTGRNTNGKDCNHFVPGAAQHDLLGLE